MAGLVTLVKATCGRRRNLLKRRNMTSGQDDRKDRLAQALRDNLRRRKAQTRAGEAEPRSPATKGPRQPD